uniref:Adenylate kinase 9 n=1 Tax=Phallusia mammillata TaxID=59560 RepID=A0A6F9D5Y6_9ASCI|nr:adenylate kinase 9 [Phallusia mammillata]
MSGTGPTQDYVFRQTQEMFPQLEPEVIYIILSENDFNIVKALDQLSILCPSTPESSASKAEDVERKPNQTETATVKKWDAESSTSLPESPSTVLPSEPTSLSSQLTPQRSTKFSSRKARRRAAKQKSAAKNKPVSNKTKNNTNCKTSKAPSENKSTDHGNTATTDKICVKKSVPEDISATSSLNHFSPPLNWDEEPTTKEAAPDQDVTIESEKDLLETFNDNHDVEELEKPCIKQLESIVPLIEKNQPIVKPKGNLRFIIVRSYTAVGKWNGMRFQFSGEGQQQPSLINGVSCTEHPSVKFNKKEKSLSKSSDIIANRIKSLAVSRDIESVEVPVVEVNAGRISTENKETVLGVEEVIGIKEDYVLQQDEFSRLKLKLNRFVNSSETMQHNSWSGAWDFSNPPLTAPPRIRQPRTLNNAFRGFHPQGPGMGPHQRFRHPFQQPHGFNTPPRLQRFPDRMSRKQRNNSGPASKAKKLLYILRGAPGSGKSTLARQLAGPRGCILSTDDFFVQPNGFYVFNPSSLQQAHLWNQDRARNFLRKGHSPVIIDNTNMTAWEMTPYVVEGAKNSYYIQIKEPDTWWKNKAGQLAKRNSHGVPKETIKAMLDRYERNVTVQSILHSERARLSANQSPSVKMNQQTFQFTTNPPSKVTSTLVDTEGNSMQSWPILYQTDKPVSQQNQDGLDLFLEGESSSCDESGNEEINNVTAENKSNIENTTCALESNSGEDSESEEVNKSPTENVTELDSNAVYSLGNNTNFELSTQFPCTTSAEVYLSSDNSSLSDGVVDESHSFDNAAFKMLDTETNKQTDIKSQATALVDEVMDNVTNGKAVFESKITPEFEELANTLDSFSLKFHAKKSVKLDTEPAESVHSVPKDTEPIMESSSVNKSPKKSKKRSSKKQPESLLQDIHFDSDWGDFLNSIQTTNAVTQVEQNNKPPKRVEMKDSFAWTDPEDFIRLRQFEHGDHIETTTGFKFIFANSYSFIPISLSDVETPDSVLDKSTSTNEYEMQNQDPNDDLKTLQALFPNLSPEHLHEVYMKCGRDLHWTTDIIAESSLFGTDENTLLGSESRTSPVGAQISLQTLDDYYNEVSLNDFQKLKTTSLPDKPTDTTQEIPAVSIQLPLEFLHQVSTFAGEDLPEIHTQVVQLEMDAALNLYVAWKNANLNKKDTVNEAVSLPNSSDEPSSSNLKLRHILSEESVPVDIQQIEEDEKLARRLQMEETHGLQEYKKTPNNVRFPATPPRHSQPLIGVSSGSLWSPGFNGSPSTLYNGVGHWSTEQKQQSEPFSRIMQEEKAAEASQEKQRASTKNMKLAAQMKRDQLKMMYPKIPEDLLNDMFQKNNYNMEETMYAIACIWSNDDSYIFNTVTTTGSLLPNAEQTSEDVSEMTDKIVDEETDPISACLGERVLSYQELRAEANLHRKEMHECHRKAAAANHQSKGSLAMYYASQAQLHKKYLREANNRAAELTYKQMNEGRSKDELDLHGLHVDEAIDTMRSVIARKRQENESRHLFIITGWGRNSATGTSKVKSAVTEWLKQTGVTFSKVNEGYLKINL